MSTLSVSFLRLWSALTFCFLAVAIASETVGNGEVKLLNADSFSSEGRADPVEFGRRRRHRRQVGTNIDAALRNPSFVRFQLSCLLDRGSCDRIGQRIKSLLPEMVSTGQCGQCTAHEVGQAGKVIIFIQEHYPMEYDLLEKKYVQEAEAQEVHDQERIGMGR